MPNGMTASQHSAVGCTDSGDCKSQTDSVRTTSSSGRSKGSSSGRGKEHVTLLPQSTNSSGRHKKSKQSHVGGGTNHNKASKSKEQTSLLSAPGGGGGGSAGQRDITLIPGRDINHEGPMRVYKWEDF